MQVPNQTNRLALVIFDCDGVLIDSEILAARVHAAAFAAIGHDISVADLLRRFTGVPDAEMYVMLQQEWGCILPANFDARAKEGVTAAYQRELQAIEGVHDAVAAIDFPVCVASSSSPAKLRFGLTLVGLHDRFAPNIFSASQVRRGKPAPDIFLFAAEQMRTDPADCLVIEDSVAGVKAARAASMPVLGFVGASHCLTGHGDRLIEEGAFAVIQHMSELPGMIEGLHVCDKSAKVRS